MKKSFLLFILSFSTLFLSAQGTWTQKANWGAGGRTFASSLSIGSKAYVGLGEYPLVTPHNDWWEWNQTTNVWTQKANFGGAARGNAVTFTIGNKGYVGTGGTYSQGPFYNDLWEYDNVANTWTAKASLPAAARMLASGFSIGAKGYIGTGRTSGSGSYVTDFWEWDQATNIWSQKANFAGVPRESASYFSIGTKGYIGTGDNGSVGYKDFWEWDQASNTWNQKADFGGVVRSNGVGFSLGTKGYIGAGAGSSYFSDFWEWNQSTNSWSQVANYGGGPRSSATAFSIGNFAYVALGGDGGSSSNMKQDLWEFSPAGNPQAGAWVQRADFGGTNRFQAAAFSIGTKGYIGTGKEAVGTGGTARKDFWAWDQPTNVWTQLADFGGSARNDAVGFSIGSKGYIGTGGAGADVSGTWTQDFWEYDPASNLWTQKANFPGGLRTRAAGFSVGSKGYIGTGWSNSSYHNDLWEWDQATNTWVQKANLPGSARWDAVGISIGNKGYLGTGYYSGELSDFWEFDPIANSWVQKANFAGGLRTNACGFAYGGKGYLGSGFLNPNAKSDFWEWDPGTNAWTQIPNYGGGVRFEAVGFAIGNRGYVGTGLDNISGGLMHNDFWEYSNSQCTAPPFTTSQTNISCGGGYNGSASITATGGVSPFTYVWNTFPIQTTSSISNLSPGLYIGTITDALGCSASTNFNITQASAPSAVTSVTNANCSSSTSGSINLSVSGGTVPYTYDWSNQTTSQNATGLVPGMYSVIISDANGCSNLYVDTVGAVNPSYSVAFTSNPQAGTAPFTPAFANATPNPANYNFTWYFGDGVSAANNNPTVFHTYQFNGYYDVTLVATSIATGCSDTLSQPGFIFATGGAGCTHTVAITPSATQNTCQGDTVVLSCNTDPSFTYQWNVNSIAISGATSSTLAITQSGYYGVTVTKNGCPVTSAAVQVNVTSNPPAPVISSLGSIVACIGGSVTLTASNIPGVTYLWSTGGTTASVVVTSGGAYSVIVSNTAGCSATQMDSVSSGVTSLPICMVTVDSSSTKNQIVWAKPVTTAIDSFKIYREVASSYKHIGSVPYSALSTFTDNTAGVNPKITAYKYKISVVDTCGGESPLSTFHRTIHLSIGAAIPCGYNLFWNDYIGLPVTQYRIMRDSAGAGWQALDSVSFGTTAWTDINCYPSQDTIAYRLEIDHPGGCVVSIKDPQPMANLNMSKSNVQKNMQVATSISTTVQLPNITILPNPSSGLFTLKSDANITSVEVMNLLGERIYSSVNANYTKAEIDLSDRTDGVYLLRVNSVKGSVVRKIIINK